MKKIIAITLGLVMVCCAFAACSKADAPATDAVSETVTYAAQERDPACQGALDLIKTLTAEQLGLSSIDLTEANFYTKNKAVTLEGYEGEFIRIDLQIPMENGTNANGETTYEFDVKATFYVSKSYDVVLKASTPGATENLVQIDLTQPQEETTQAE